ncbi:MAG: glutamate--tRNA ligase [Rhodobacteraceae bacterium]|nr:glutamate--tRNA ligase [Paracoccaceae bacterium]
MIRTRFAPSPTGLLHVGNIRTALFNYLVARQAGGTFILRFDDTDRARSRQEFIDAIRHDLEWLGLVWDEEVRQSDRLDRYADRAVTLRANGLLYECFESSDELDLKRKLQRQQGKPPIYDRAALRLTDSERTTLRQNTAGYWRFHLDGSEITWTDGIQGPVTIGTANVSDPVLVRADGQYLYTFASVVDDIDMQITDIVRGADHLTNSAVQIPLIQALGSQPPRFTHHSLLVGPGGAPLAKRDNSLSIATLREQGIEPLVILSRLASLGTADGVRIVHTLDALVDSFNVTAFNANSTTYSAGDLPGLNSDYLRNLDYAAIASHIHALGVPDRIAPQFWSTLRSNISNRSDLDSWWAILRDGVAPDIPREDQEFVTHALTLLPPPPYSESTWQTWTAAAGKSGGRSKSALYRPLRLALTGRETGPSMRDLMPLMQAIAWKTNDKKANNR